MGPEHLAAYSTAWSPTARGRHPTPRGSREAGPPGGGCPHPAIPFSPKGRSTAWATPASLQGTLRGGRGGLCPEGHQWALQRALPSRPLYEPPSGHSNREGPPLPRGHTASGATRPGGGHALCLAHLTSKAARRPSSPPRGVIWRCHNPTHVDGRRAQFRAIENNSDEQLSRGQMPPR